LDPKQTTVSRRITNAVGQLGWKLGPDEIGREECERDRHVPESLAFGDSIDANDWIIDQFIEPTAVLCD
jgi:hypothetical protein